MRRVCKAKGIDDWPAVLEGRFFIGFTLPQLSSDGASRGALQIIREQP